MSLKVPYIPKVITIAPSRLNSSQQVDVSSMAFATNQQIQSDDTDNNNNWLIGLLCVLGLGGLIGGGIYWHKKSNNTSGSNNSNSTSSSTAPSGSNGPSGGRTPTEDDLYKIIANYMCYGIRTDVDERANLISNTGDARSVDKANNKNNLEYAQQLWTVFNDATQRAKFETVAKTISSRYLTIAQNLNTHYGAPLSVYGNALSGESDEILAFVSRDIAKQLYYHNNQSQSNSSLYPTIQHNVLDNPEAQYHVLDVHFGWEIGFKFLIDIVNNGNLSSIENNSSLLANDSLYHALSAVGLKDEVDKSIRAHLTQYNGGLPTLKDIITASELGQFGRNVREKLRL